MMVYSGDKEYLHMIRKAILDATLSLFNSNSVTNIFFS